MSVPLLPGAALEVGAEALPSPLPGSSEMLCQAHIGPTSASSKSSSGLAQSAAKKWSVQSRGTGRGELAAIGSFAARARLLAPEGRFKESISGK
jgi:hypothetical protein